ncbi:hypothetical protein [Microvirga sp. Mcv34]|uniref:hypothetical protein n=1 Tax=Microvirga sp. Mcv34 TaxID=2926016 RepID=UPI0021C76469|nr:hypothetical protein [Microvirga sp. Mcv34]
MTPIFRGLLVATIAAPYLCLLFTALFQNGLADARISDALGFAIGAGTIALLWFGVPVFLIGGLVSGWLEALGLRSRKAMITGGAALGCSFLAPFLLIAQKDDWIFPVAGMLAGAICGWIYWLIAIRQKPEGKSPITSL